MSENNQEQDRNEPATPFKLREARRRGQVAKSMEMNGVLLLLAAALVIGVAGESMIGDQLRLSKNLLQHAHEIPLDGAGAMRLFKDLALGLFQIYWPIILVLVSVAIAINMGQTGPVFSMHPVKPDFKRLSPVAGFKRLFSVRLMFESAKVIVKIVLLMVALFLLLRDLLPSLFSLLEADARTTAAFTLAQTVRIGIELALVLLVIAVIDVVYVRHEYTKKMRMSRREVKEEIKRREGDPHVRAKIRELQREAASRAGALQDVAKSDVVITNPTHIAVALLYDRSRMNAPQVMAKGAGDMAEKIRVLARRHNVPLVENKHLARLLFKKSELGVAVPVEFFPAVAKILVWVYAMRRGKSGADRPGPAQEERT